MRDSLHYSHATIRQCIADIELEMKSEKILYEKALLLLKREIELIQLQCDHIWGERSIMGRDTVIECKMCGLERH